MAGFGTLWDMQFSENVMTQMKHVTLEMCIRFHMLQYRPTQALNEKQKSQQNSRYLSCPI